MPPGSHCASSAAVSAPYTVLRDIELQIAPGEVIALVGPSGSGKSTLLRVIAGLDGPTEGEVVLNGRLMRGVDHSARWFPGAAVAAVARPRGQRRIGTATDHLADRRRGRVRRGLEIGGLAGFEGHRRDRCPGACWNFLRYPSRTE
ncbi:ATP-binding cassette domain-containing protein [Nocardia sp. CA-135953]|uniref:ATP-binding cassette domain-containing protein n=1 Tax=Nocardia sp. CA-135953 TaxID=3239978 RepID=UPI003D97017E